MKKTLLVLALFAVATFSGLNLKAQSPVFSHSHQGTTLYYIVDSTGNAIVVPPLHPGYDTAANQSWTGYAKPQGVVVIPDSVPYGGSNHAVTATAPRAFLSCDSMTSVSLPSTLTDVGPNSFRLCTALPSIVIPEGAIG